MKMKHTSIYDIASATLNYRGTSFNLGLRKEATSQEVFAAHHIIDFYLGDITLDACIRNIRNEFYKSVEEINQENKKRREDLEKAYKAGWNASGEGYNSEVMYDLEGLWKTNREKELDKIIVGS